MSTSAIRTRVKGIGAPFLTIQHAANIATAGDHVEIRAGTYNETVIPKHSGTASAPIVFEAYKGEGVTILLVGQNVNYTLQISHYGYVMETGRITLEGPTEMLMNNEFVRRAYLGLAGSPVPLPPALASQREQRSGLRIAQVVSGGPAAKAGLRAGDLLLSAGGSPVSSAQSLQRLMLADAIGRPLTLTVIRNEAMVDVVVVPTELPTDV